MLRMSALHFSGSSCLLMDIVIGCGHTTFTLEFPGSAPFLLYYTVGMICEIKIIYSVEMYISSLLADSPLHL
jgi:hypothetical protein